MQTRWVHCTLY